MFNRYTQLGKYSKIINQEINTFDNLLFWEFIDKTFCEVVKSTNKQQEIYSNYKKNIKSNSKILYYQKGCW